MVPARGPCHENDLVAMRKGVDAGFELIVEHARCKTRPADKFQELGIGNFLNAHCPVCKVHSQNFTCIAFV